MKFKKYIIMLISIFVVTFMLLIWLSRVDQVPNNRDEIAIRQIIGNINCHSSADFNHQVNCIQDVQRILKEKIPDMRCVNKRELVEPSEFVNRSYGCCFDRARFIEKTLVLMDFEVRRVAMYDASKYGLLSLLIPGISSHAATEVLTQKGWMGVDSNELFVLVDKNNNPVTYSNIKRLYEQLSIKPAPASFFANDLVIVYGLYSRHGLSHEPMIPVPEVHVGQLLKYQIQKSS